MIKEYEVTYSDGTKRREDRVDIGEAGGAIFIFAIIMFVIGLLPIGINLWFVFKGFKDIGYGLENGNSTIYRVLSFIGVIGYFLMFYALSKDMIDINLFDFKSENEWLNIVIFFYTYTVLLIGIYALYNRKPHDNNLKTNLKNLINSNNNIKDNNEKINSNINQKSKNSKTFKLIFKLIFGIILIIAPIIGYIYYKIKFEPNNIITSIDYKKNQNIEKNIKKIKKDIENYNNDIIFKSLMGLLGENTNDNLFLKSLNTTNSLYEINNIEVFNIIIKSDSNILMIYNSLDIIDIINKILDNLKNINNNEELLSYDDAFYNLFNTILKDKDFNNEFYSGYLSDEKNEIINKLIDLNFKKSIDLINTLQQK
jgi:hypothetical protein